jgi:hypothetical protein
VNLIQQILYYDSVGSCTQTLNQCPECLTQETKVANIKDPIVHECTRDEFADLMLNTVDDNNFVWQIMFTGEAAFHINSRLKSITLAYGDRTGHVNFTSICKTLRSY